MSYNSISVLVSNIIYVLYSTTSLLIINNRINSTIYTVFIKYSDIDIHKLDIDTPFPLIFFVTNVVCQTSIFTISILIL